MTALLSGCHAFHPVSTQSLSVCVSGSACATPSTATATATATGTGQASTVQPVSAAARASERAADGYNRINARIDALRNACAATLATPELNPIRDKIEIFHDPAIPAPYPYAMLDIFPTRADVPLIEKWSALRDACIKQEHEIDLTSPELTPMAQSATLQGAAFAGIVEAKIRRLTASLSQRKLTYGEFAQRRYQINSASGNAASRVAMALGIGDPGRRILEQSRIERQFSAEADTFERYLRAVDARRPATVSLASATAIGSRAAGQTCVANCASYSTPEEGPFKGVRHGVIWTSGGLGGTTTTLVDFDIGTLSVIEFALVSRGGEVQSGITHRSNIVLAPSDLARLRAIANMIWISFGPVPIAQAALGNFWEIRVVDGEVVRSERGSGDAGGAGRDLNVALRDIEERQLAHFLFENRRMYRVWSCHDYPSAGHAGLPRSYIRTSGYGWSDLGHVPSAFPIPSTDPLRFRFDVEETRWTCAD
ncbi:hypothetical protein [Burkholderia paludis]|uniref:hypothetical protein n=1 Tax=Burkholderia paludis TaxID=1506587 RepID=UPI001269B811|nr:hypothetical protein [Burkholderia paludis]